MVACLIYASLISPTPLLGNNHCRRLRPVTGGLLLQLVNLRQAEAWVPLSLDHAANASTHTKHASSETEITAGI